MKDNYVHRLSTALVSYKGKTPISDLVNAMSTACELNNVTVVKKDYHLFPEFNGFQGCSVSFILAESHLYIHTYPEFNYLTISCQTCGESVSPEKVLESFKNIIQGNFLKINNFEFDN